MRFMGILAAVMLVIGPALAHAEPAVTTAKYERPAPGPVASATHEDDDEIRVEELILLCLIICGGGAALFALLNDGGDSSTTTSN